MLWKAPSISLGWDERRFRDIVAMSFKEIEEILNGRIDSKNTREIGGYVVGITSLMSKNGVVGLSSVNTDDDDIRIWAGSVDRGEAAYRVYESGLMVATNALITGTVTASEFIGGTITGSLIQTSESGVYPRIELSSTQNLVKAEGSPTTKVEVNALGSSGLPAIYVENGTIKGVIQATSTLFMMGTLIGPVHISTVSDIWLIANRVRFDNWSKIYNDNTNRTLQDELNSLSARIAALGG